MKYIKIVLIILLVIGTFEMPYYYYEIMKFLCMVGFLILSKHDFDKKNNITLTIWLILALLINPYLKLDLESDIWDVIDIVIILILTISIFLDIIINKSKPSVNLLDSVFEIDIKKLYKPLLIILLGSIFCFVVSGVVVSKYNERILRESFEVREDLSLKRDKLKHLEKNDSSISEKQFLKNQISELYWKEKELNEIDYEVAILIKVVVVISYCSIILIYFGFYKKSLFTFNH